MSFTFFTALSALFIIGCFTQDAPEVDTPLGRVRGFYGVSYKGRRFSAFEGIPFAEAPIGELRFKAPQAIKPWTGIWQATEQHTCIQMDMFGLSGQRGLTGQEDCLYLNVFTPSENPSPSDNLDVIVHIHGGAFMLGSSHMVRPNLLMDREYVLVTMNYRLGALGFLCVEDEQVSCNNGLKDQTLALRWIQENIKSFGGNPDSVTITGMSAGGGSVHYHYLSSLSKGLFHRGFSMSGTALCPWALQETPLEHARIISNHLGCGNSPTEIVTCLKSRSATSVVSSYLQLLKFLIFPLVPFGPTVEPENHVDPFIRDHPYKLLKSGQIVDVPWLNSAASDEGLLFVMLSNLAHNLDTLNEQWENVIHYIVDTYDVAKDKYLEDIADQIKDHYFQSSEVTINNLQILSQIISDRHFLSDFARAAQLQAKVANSPVYNFIVEYGTPQSMARQILKQNFTGAFHGDDMQFLFSGAEQLTEDDEAMVEIYLNMLDAFVKTDKPHIDGIDWQPVQKSGEVEFVIMKSPKEIKVEKARNIGQQTFWESLPLREYEHLYSLKDEL